MPEYMATTVAKKTFLSIYSIYYLGWNTIFTHIELITPKEPSEIYNPFESRGGLYVSWQLILGFVSAVIWPTAITRALAMDSPKSVKKQYQWSSLSFMIRFIVPSFLGIFNPRGIGFDLITGEAEGVLTSSLIFSMCSMIIPAISLPVAFSIPCNPGEELTSIITGP